MYTKSQKTLSVQFSRISSMIMILIMLISAIGVNPVSAAPVNVPSLQSESWFDAAWAYRRPVTITNAGSELTDYPVSITLDSSFDFAHAKSDGSDLRVTSDDGLTPLPFWIETWTASSAIIWVKLPSIPTGDTMLYLYYGNPVAVALSNGIEAFGAYDGFEDYPVGSVPPPGAGGALQWSGPSGTVVVTDSPTRHGSRSLRFTGASSLTGTFAPLAHGFIGVWLRRPSISSGDLDIYFYSSGGLAAVAGLGQNGFHYWNGSFQDTGVAWNVDTWYLVTIALDATTGLFDFVVYDESLTELVRVQDIHFATSLSAISSAMFYASSAYAGNGYADDFRVTPLYGTQPTLEIGSEQAAPPVEGANVVLTNSDSPDPVEAGSSLTYTLEVTNMGPLAATGVALTDTLSVGAGFGSASAGCTYNSSNREVTCDLGSLANGASTSVTITITPASPGTLTNTATVTANETDPSTSNNTAQTQTTVLKGCPCSIWSDTTVPANPSAGDGRSAEFGVKFRADRNGYITGLRFYKGSGNTGLHVGHLWTSAGVLLAETSFTGESASGWQEAVVSPPVAITADTTYVASYHTYQGSFAVNYGYFGLGIDNSPLRALRDGEDGPNGVFLYGDTGFPIDTFSSSNYWVDVVFSTSAVDAIPPSVNSVFPASTATGVEVNTAVTATFSEGIDLTTVNATTFLLQDPSATAVTATVTYSAGSKTAALHPLTDLAESTTYTAILKGGVQGIKDLAGNSLSADYTWTFTTSVPPPPPPNEGPGGPILIVSSESNPFTRYYVEILRNEGLNAFTASDIRSVSAETLTNYDVVILGEKGLTTEQANMFSDWVTAGGQLIAMRPDKKLAELLGLADASAMLSNAYLLVNSATVAGAGIVDETMQFHGTADLYTLGTATSLATLYSNATTATEYPAVTLHQVGPNGGQAAAFTYDLARSVIYTRQGNPAWDGQHRDAIGRGWKTPHDLFYGAATYDPQPDWVDFNKIAIPQADEQQRLLANLILQMNLHKKPLPRFWYLPRGEKAVVLMTGDDHGSNGTTGRFQHYQSISPAGCSVADWECIRSTTYLYTFTPLDDAQAAAFTTDGFDVELHIDTGCSDFTPSTIDGFYVSQIEAWTAKYQSLPAPSSNRVHCVVWSDWASQAKAESSHGMRLDTSYYYFTPNWVQNRPGYFTGSGMPMRFADLDGTRIDVYQAVTQMTDESGQSYPFTIDTLLDRALGPEGYYGVLTVNAHTNEAPSGVSDAVVASALQHHVPIVSARQMLTWLDGRNNSSFGSLSWNDNSLHFTIVVGAGANGLQAMLPAASADGPLGTLTRDGTGVTFTKETIKGIEYARFPAVAGAYQATYEVDDIPPVISSVVASSPSANTAVIRWTTNETSDSRVEYGLTPSSLNTNVSATALTALHSIQLTGLVADARYYYRVISKDAYGNSSTYPVLSVPPAEFRMPANRFIDTSTADFNAGTPNACYIAQIANGEVMLLPSAGSEFYGTDLPADWYSTPSATGGSGSVSNGVLTIDGAWSGTSALYSPGRSLDFVATLTPGENQYLGFGISYSEYGYAMFSNDGSGLSVHTTDSSANSFQTAISGSLLGASHHYRIDWKLDGVDYYVDGALVASHALAVTNQLRPVGFDRNLGAGSISIEWLRMSPYDPSCMFVSRVFDAGETREWLDLNGTVSAPVGTAVSFETRSSTDNLSWTTWQALEGSENIASLDGRYIQYRATLTRTDPGQTPMIESVMLSYGSVSNIAPVAVDDHYTTDEDTILTVPAPGVLGNDTDTGPVTAIKVSGPAHGTAGLSTDGSFTYTPDAGFAGEDTFTYTANDGTADSNIATVGITIDPTTLCVNPGGTDGCVASIQAAIDAASDGDTINVYPGTYDQDEANGWNPDTGDAGANDFNIFVNKAVTIQGVDASGNPITSYADAAANVIAKRALPTFGQSTFFVQADHVMITGLEITGWSGTGNNKTVEVVGDNFTLKYSKVHGMDSTASVYLNDRHFDSGTNTSHVQTYHVEANLLDGGGSADGIRISSGAGWTGPASGRVITNNTFANVWDGISFVGPGGDAWDVYPVGAATITGNNFNTAQRRHVIAWGTYGGTVGYGELDWSGILASNTFDKAVTVWTPTNELRSYDSVPFAYIRGIYTMIQTYPIDRVAQNGDTIQIGAGTYKENITVTKSVTIAGAGASTILQPATSNPNCGGAGGGSLCAGSSNVILVQADNVIIHDLTVDGDNPALTSTYNVGGANLDARNGIITNHNAGVFNGLEVHDTIVRNIYLRGIYASSNGTFNFHDNTVTNVRAEYASIGIFAYYGPGIIANNTVSYANDAISANHSRGIQFLNNTVTHSGSGVHTDNNGDSGGTADLIQGNTVSDCSTDGYGIWTFVNYLPVVVENNTVTNCALGLSAWGTAPSLTVPVTFTGNVVTGPNKAVGSVGAYLTTSGAGWGYYDLYANFSNNTFTNFEYGVQISSEETIWEPGPFVQKSIHAALSHNQIYGNTNGADKGASLNIEADLREQWWGATDGPAGAGSGSGDTISAGLAFVPWCTDADCTTFSPEAVTLGAPSGALDNWNNSFNWAGIGSANYYILEVYDEHSGGMILRQWFALSTAGCDSDTSCAVSPETLALLANGSYKWRIQDYGSEYGYGQWTPFLNFTLTRPESMVLQSPNGDLTSWNNTFSWSGMSGANYYILEVYDTSSNAMLLRQWFALSTAGCDSDTSCAVSPETLALLANGSYKWRIQDYGSEYGYGIWTPFLNFTLTRPESMVLQSPSGDLTSWNNTFNWSGMSGANYYILEVYDTTSNAMILRQWFALSTAGCDSDTSCAVSPETLALLGNGSYKWRIQDYGSAYGYGMWTPFLSFTLTRPESMVLQSPSGDLTSWDNTFSWSGMSGANYYILEVYDENGGGMILRQWFALSTAGCDSDTSCAVSPETLALLTDGSYKWRIQDYGSAYGYGMWTPFLNFTLNIP